MRYTRITLILTLLLGTLNSCSAKKDTHLGSSKLILDIEERDYGSDRVTQHKIFDNGLYQKLIVHDTSSSENLFKSELKELNKKELETIASFVDKLTKLDYENSFPWKEGLYDRGNVYKLSFVSSKQLEYLTRKEAKAPLEISFEKILYYYEGHKESPLVFKDLIKYIHEVQ